METAMAEADPHKTFNVHEAKTHLSRLIDRAHAGEEIILAKAGKPYAKLVAYDDEPVPSRTPGRLAHLRDRIPRDIWFEPSFTEAELDSFENKSVG
jgi:prevent-host-death family protein